MQNRSKSLIRSLYTKFTEVEWLMTYTTHLLPKGCFNAKNEMIAVHIVEVIKQTQIGLQRDGQTADGWTDRKMNGKDDTNILRFQQLLCVGGITKAYQTQKTLMSMNCKYNSTPYFTSYICIGTLQTCVYAYFSLHIYSYYIMDWCDKFSISVFSCDQAALWMVFSVCPSLCLSVCPSHLLTMFPSSYHHEIFRSYHHGPG